jgi:hypothetical protein
VRGPAALRQAGWQPASSAQPTRRGPTYCDETTMYGGARRNSIEPQAEKLTAVRPTAGEVIECRAR